MSHCSGLFVNSDTLLLPGGIFAPVMTESDKIGSSHRFDKFENLMQYHQVKLSRERRVLIPAAVRAKLGIGEGTRQRS